MAGGKRPSLPAVLTGNDLVSGSVVYFTGSGWSAAFEEALVARDEAGLARLEQALAVAEAGGSPVLAYVMKVGLAGAGEAVPDHYRDRIRRNGPTVAAGQAFVREVA